MSTLIQQWPLAVINHMGWRQPELEEKRAAAKTWYQQSRPSCCTFCGILIKCDMYRHVARCHLDLAQLWWCPVSWCTVWKGTPQDCMDHIRGAHDVPGEIQYLPPWTVTRQVWTDSLTPRHSGISTDVLLFSDIGLSLIHHYRFHIAFRRNYMSQLRALLPLPAVLPTAGELPDFPRSSLMCPAGTPDPVVASPRTSRRAVRRRRPVRVMEPPVQNVPVLTVQDPLAAAGAVVLDCRPPLLPVSMDISGVDLLAIRAPAVSAGAGVLPPDREQLFGGGDLLSFICPELGVTLLVDPSMDVRLAGTHCERSGALSAQADVDIELCQVFQDVGALPEMVTPVGDPEGGFVVTSARYPVPPDSRFVGGIGGAPGGTFPGWADRRGSGDPEVVDWVGGSVVGVYNVTGDVHA